MKLSEIEAYAYEVIYPDCDGELFFTLYLAKERAAEVGGDIRKLHTPEQMQEYSEVKRDYILIIDGGIGTKLYATDRFTGTEAVDVYGDKYKVVNHVKNGKMWVLDKEDTKK